MRRLLRLYTNIPEMPLEHFREFVKHVIDGYALGCVPFFLGEGALPCLYDTNVIYQEEPNHGRGLEEFALPPEVLERGWGDCDDLCIYRIAYLRAHGVPATASVADWLNMGGLHVQVRLPSGEIEDPSMVRGATSSWPEAFLYDRE